MKQILLLASTLLLSACVPGQTAMHGGDAMHGGEKAAGGHMMGGAPDADRTPGLLPGAGVALADLPPAKLSAVLRVEDGDTIELNPTLVRKAIKGKETAMYGYNGQVPGPLLRAEQGATFTVKVRNEIDLPTAVHWHGLRLDNASDGAAGMTQEAIEPGGEFTYTVTVPDEGLYWYHSHVREDIQQPLGLYGNILVTPRDAAAYASVNREEVLAVGDVLLDKTGQPDPFGTDAPDHALMGRFGDTMLVKGEPSYALTASKGEVVRFFLTDVASTRTFRIDFGKAPMKLVGGDNGRYERERMVTDVVLSPSERAIVDVHFPEAGTYVITHRTPQRSYRLGTVTVSDTAASPSHAQAFSALAAHADVTADVNAFRDSFTKDPDHTLLLTMQGMMGHGGMMGGPSADGIEWEDEPGMGAMMDRMTRWQLVDRETGAANEKLVYRAQQGDRVKIRIVNDKDSGHPMQHPIHIHGQRFLVLSDNGVQTDNFVWKDTVLVPAGHTVDILVDASNPGDWMIHCHIAEHLGNGMMASLRIE